MLNLGALLAIVMMLGIIGLPGMRLNAWNENVVADVWERTRAVQAADAAVQTCLDQLDTGTYSGMLHSPAAAGKPPPWEVRSNWSTSPSNTATTPVDISSMAIPLSSRCLVESLGAGSYRVTGRAAGGSPSVEVVLQATYSAKRGRV